MGIRDVLTKLTHGRLAVCTRVPESGGRGRTLGVVEDEKARARRERGELSVARGKWGEDMAAAYLGKRGMMVVGRNVRPCVGDRRCEIDLIVQTKDARTVIFVEVKTHCRRSERASRLWCIDKRKRGILLKACTNWILRNKWHGNFRFDVIEVYGVPEGAQGPEIDHIENVHLFPAKWRFW